MCSEEFGEVHAGSVGEVFELGAAGEAVREQHSVCVCVAQGGQQCGFGDGHGDVVVPASCIFRPMP